MRKVKFIVDFANQKAGSVGDYDSPLASRLVRVCKVAEYVDSEAKAEPVKKAKK